ncbi:MAG: hypothetical protein JXB25_04915 [Deltaproteobacteria bacterium]|nr:hypothetical protein [Deltaproteobacteria bacterium]
MGTKWKAFLLSAAILVFSGVAMAEPIVVYVPLTAPYSDTSMIAKGILDSCKLPEGQIDFLEEAAQADGGFKIVRDKDAAKKKGLVLLVEITNAISGGNAFVGHHKQVSIKGRLLKNGVEIGNFTGFRSSGGGAWAGYKSSCGVLERCIKVLGKDVIQWLKNPGKNGRIGQ